MSGCECVESSASRTPCYRSGRCSGLVIAGKKLPKTEKCSDDVAKGYHLEPVPETLLPVGEEMSAAKLVQKSTPLE